MRVRSAATVLTLALGVAGCASTAQRPADITQLSVVDAAQLIRDKKVTSVELTQAYLTRAEAHRDLNAYITLDRAGALAAARRADADLAAGRNRGPLHGVPLVVKDNVHVAGLPNTAGTPGLKRIRPARDRAHRAATGGGRRGDPGQDEHARAGLRHLRLQRGLLHCAADRHAQSLRPHTHRRRQLQRDRRGDRRAAGAGRTGQRHRRLGPHPRGPHRHRRTAPDHRTLQPGRRHADLALTRHRGADGPDRGRRGAAATPSSSAAACRRPRRSAG